MNYYPICGLFTNFETTFPVPVLGLLVNLDSAWNNGVSECPSFRYHWSAGPLA